MRTTGFLKRVIAALVLLILACGHADSATELSEGEVRFKMSAPEFDHLFPSRPIAQFETMSWNLWESPTGLVRGLSGSCWPKEGSFYVNGPQRDVLGRTPVPYSWTSEPEMCGSVGGSCVLVGPDGVDPGCRSFIHSATLVPSQDNNLYAIMLNVYSFEPVVGDVTSILTDGNAAVVDFTIRWEPTPYYRRILEEFGYPEMIDHDRKLNPWLQPHTVRVYFHYYEELKPEKEWQGWRIVGGARPH
jgi:hypothetical protein